MNTRDRKGLTPLYLAAYNGRVGCVGVLLQLGADHALVTPRGVTPLHAACDHGWAPVVSALLSYANRPDVNARTNTGTTPLYYACPSDDSPREETPRSGGDNPGRPDFPRCVRLLLKSQADPNIAQDDGWRPLHAASYFTGNATIVKALLTHRAEPDVPIPEGSTPLHLASQEGHSAAVKLLLVAKADVNPQKGDGATPLYMASKQGHDACVKTLLQGGADPDMTLNSRGHGPLHIAAESGHARCVELLLKHGATLDTVGARSPLALAREHGHKDVCDILEKPKGEKSKGCLFACFTGSEVAETPSRPSSVAPPGGKSSKEPEIGRTSTGRRSTLGRSKCPYYEVCKEFIDTLQLPGKYYYN